MHTLFALLSLATLAQRVIASPAYVRSAYNVKETHAVPPKWRAKGRAPLDHVLNLQIGLKQGRFAELEKHLLEGL